VIELYKRNGGWQKRPPEEQQSFLRPVRQEYVTPSYVDAAQKYFSGRVVVATDLAQF
jgi:hypothetical protein